MGVGGAGGLCVMGLGSYYQFVSQAEDVAVVQFTFLDLMPLPLFVD